MPIVTTIQYGREELEELVLSEAVDGARWDLPAIGTVTGEGVVVRQVGVVTRSRLAGIVQTHEPQAAGQIARVVALGPKGMKVELTPKPTETAEEA